MIRPMNATKKVVDMGEAAALVVSGYRLNSLESARAGGNFKIFVFKESIDIEFDQTLRNYKSGSLQVDALAYYNAIRDLKKQIADTNALNGA